MGFLSGLRPPPRNALAEVHPMLRDVVNFQQNALANPPTQADQRRAVRNTFRGNSQPPPLVRNALAPRHELPPPQNTTSVRAHNPTLGETIGNLLGSGARSAGFSPQYSWRLAREAGDIPILGDLMMAGDAASNANRGNYATGAGQGALAAIGLIPGVGDAAAGGIRRGIRAFHGSPHQFDRFVLSPETVGTGEGAQAFGHGLYFAENPEVAREYQRQLATAKNAVRSMANRRVRGMDNIHSVEVIPTAGQPIVKINGRTRTGDDVSYAAEQIYARQGSVSPDDLRAYFGERTGEIAPGHVYEVNINADPSRLLDWDAPLSEQSIQQQLAASARGQGGLRGMAGQMRGDADLSRITGEQFYNALNDRVGNYVNTSAAADRLRGAGIPGIRFLDQRSRAVGNGTRNYVIFDDGLIDIVNRY